MGIPLYFHKITNTHKHIISPKKQRCDRLFLDFNGIIHNVFQTIKHKVDLNMSQVEFETNLNQEVVKYMEYILDYTKPKELVYICIDGVAPLPKIQQQRKRRYLSAWLRSQQREEGYVWDSNAISPGTDYMSSLNKHLRDYIKNTNTKFEIILSDSSQKGEGEHKIFDYIHYHPNDNFIDVIYGLDADLIMLSISCNKSKKFLLREPQHMHQYNSTIPFLWFDVEKFKTSLLEYHDHMIDIHSYVFLCFLIGNDFLPNVTYLTIHNDGIHKIVNTYIRLLKKNGSSTLIKENGDVYEIDTIILKNLIEELAKYEDDEMKSLHKSYYDKSMIFKTNKMRLENYGISHKDTLSKEIFKQKNWRLHYYYNLFNTNQYNDNITNDVTKCYIKGLKWVCDYYFNKTYNNNWYYKYNYSPTLLDMYNFLEVNRNVISDSVIERTINITTDIQLLLILPKLSINILPEHLRHIMTNRELGMYYPKNFSIHTYLKTKLHECFPILPIIDISLLEFHIMKTII